MLNRELTLQRLDNLSEMSDDGLAVYPMERIRETAGAAVGHIKILNDRIAEMTKRLRRYKASAHHHAKRAKEDGKSAKEESRPGYGDILWLKDKADRLDRENAELKAEVERLRKQSAHDIDMVGKGDVASPSEH
ncbi:hypothetical protein SAMN05216312_102168 [Cohnella sp. OV330]|uniref:hypothetical protein n=1 Tax=Cohnella sp. OV330 TaxID=1855288 RepID=UPI0008E36646|nr:hypothetical protein [Cohnella sp. OV330]SFA90779.1 hypothetical protein SAMN05216312_102168 [Cohnella sp. OV330]